MEDPEAERLYQPFIVNRALSYFPETVMHAHAMTCNGFLDNKLQYHYLLNSVRPAKRFAKWAKRGIDEDIEVVRSYYKMNHSKALQVLSVLTSQQLQELKMRLERGGSYEKNRSTSGGDATAGR